MQLLIVPLFIAGVAYYLNLSQKKSELQSEKDSQQQKVFDNYLACMTDLLLNHKRCSKLKSEASSVARTRTLTVLRILDGERKSQVLQFLYESGLISCNDPVISLIGADLSGINLIGSGLVRAEIRGAYFKNADLSRAILDEAILTGCDFSNSLLTGASMNNTNLVQTIFNKADLKGASLKNSKLNDAIFSNALLSGADFFDAEYVDVNFSGVDLKTVKNIKNR